MTQRRDAAARCAGRQVAFTSSREQEGARSGCLRIGALGLHVGVRRAAPRDRGPPPVGTHGTSRPRALSGTSGSLRRSGSWGAPSAPGRCTPRTSRDEAHRSRGRERAAGLGARPGTRPSQNHLLLLVRSADGRMPSAPRCPRVVPSREGAGVREADGRGVAWVRERAARHAGARALSEADPGRGQRGSRIHSARNSIP